MKIVIAILLTAIFFISLTIGAENQEIVNFNYLLAQGEFHLSLLLGIFFASGFGLGWLICGGMYLKMSIAHHRLRKRVEKQAVELDKVRLNSTKG